MTLLKTWYYVFCCGESSWKAEPQPYLEHQYEIHALKAAGASECFHSQQQSVVEVFHANNEIEARMI